MPLFDLVAVQQIYMGRHPYKVIDGGDIPQRSVLHHGFSNLLSESHGAVSSRVDGALYPA